MPPRRRNGSPVEPPITAITVEGFKSLAHQQRVEIRPLTILAGANSSGKSSIIQPLLLIKQTLDATYDPGTLRIDEPNVRFTSSEQLFSRVGRTREEPQMRWTLEFEGGRSIAWKFVLHKAPNGLELVEMRCHEDEQTEVALTPGMSTEQIRSALPEIGDLERSISGPGGEVPESKLVVYRRRCFLDVIAPGNDPESEPIPFPIELLHVPVFADVNARRLIHVPGIRGNRERTYRATAVGATFPGTFENYVGSIILRWQMRADDHLNQLGSVLELLGLTPKVAAKRLNDTAVEIEVARVAKPGRAQGADLVNIADVGLGVSQVLPVVVALLAAGPGQMVYLEEPETHLHPRAQVALARILCDAAKRGVRVVAETHSDLLLRALQTLVAKGDMPRERVILHWFMRDPADGATTVTPAELDDSGAYGDWPEDFGDVYLDAEQSYIESAARRLGSN